MKLPTKTVASLLVATTVAAAVPGLSQIPISKRRRESQFDKLLHRHDRKGDIRAELLNIPAHEFRRLLKTMTFEQILHAHGITSKRTFRLALAGKLRDELRQRGWSRTKIDTYITRRALRVDRALQLA